jgi:hypothetical protein
MMKFTMLAVALLLVSPVMAGEMQITEDGAAPASSAAWAR